MAKGYSSYRGRKAKWKIALAGLLVLIILAAVGFMLLQRFIVYDDMGVPSLLLPGKESSQQQDPVPGELDVTIEEPEPEQEEAQLLQIVQLGKDPALWEGELAAADQQAFSVTMKAGGGQLQYVFSTGAAGQVRSTTAAAAVDVLPRLLNGEKYSVARLSCLWDGSVARANVETMGLKNTGGFLFYDGNNTNWLDPSKEATRAYLSALAVECAEVGFDEILLTDLSYPTKGKLDKIAYGDPGFAAQYDWNAEQMAGLVSAIRDALGDRPVKLSVEMPASVLESGGVDTVAGIDLQSLMPVECIYLPMDAARAETAQEILSEMSADLDNVRMIPEVERVPAGDVSYLLVTP